MALFALAGNVGAQGLVQSAGMIVSLSGDEQTADVQIEYRLVLTGPDDVPIELLGFAGAFVSEFLADGAERPTEMIPLSGSRMGASVPVTSGTLGSEHVFSMRYQVQGAIEADGAARRVRIPVLTVALPPVDGSSEVFAAEVRVPDGWTVSEGFPTGLRRDATGSYRVSLSVVPALVSMRARADGAWRPGLPLALDLVAAVILLGFSYRGWRHLRGVAE